MNILILAYACEPLKGSEPGVGWNLSVALSKVHNVTVLTRRNNKSAIEAYISKYPLDNINFVYHDLPERWMWIKKKVSEQAYYMLWNLTAKNAVKSIIKNDNIDILHHVTFNQYRTPSAGYFANKPFVVGPVGGAELINPVFYSELMPSTLKREKFRRKGRDRILFRWLGQRTNAKKAFVFSAKENADCLEKYINTKRDIIKVLPAIAINKEDFAVDCKANDKTQPFTMIYAGRALDWKGLHVFMMALAKVNEHLSNIKVLLIGIRDEKERKMVDEWKKSLELESCVELIDFMPRNELIKRLVDANLFVYPAFRDSGSMAVLEACALGCPSIAFDAGGQDAFPDDTILKVKIAESLEDTIDAFSQKLVWAYKNQDELKMYGEKAKNFALSKMNWEYRAKQISDIYNEVVK